MSAGSLSQIVFNRNMLEFNEVKFSTEQYNPITVSGRITLAEVEDILKGFGAHPNEQIILRKMRGECGGPCCDCNPHEAQKRLKGEIFEYQKGFIGQVNSKYAEKKIRFIVEYSQILTMCLDFVTEAQMNNINLGGGNGQNFSNNFQPSYQGMITPQQPNTKF